jgi:hypothetical protein
MSILSYFKGKKKQREVRNLTPDKEFQFKENYYGDTNVVEGFRFIYCNNYTEKLFKDYRGRVVERFGKELDRELRYNIKTKEVDVTTVNEDGSESTQKKTIHVAEVAEYDEFTRIFDETNVHWVKDAERNKYFILEVQAMANDKLQRCGHVFLNDIYEALGFDKTAAGQVVGWVYNLDNPIGENCIDFGIFDEAYIKRNSNFINGYERSILLNFNHDGNILEYI